MDLAPVAERVSIVGWLGRSTNAEQQQ